MKVGTRNWVFATNLLVGLPSSPIKIEANRSRNSWVMIGLTNKQTDKQRLQIYIILAWEPSDAQDTISSITITIILPSSPIKIWGKLDIQKRYFKYKKIQYKCFTLIKRVRKARSQRRKVWKKIEINSSENSRSSSMVKMNLESMPTVSEVQLNKKMFYCFNQQLV